MKRKIAETIAGTMTSYIEPPSLQPRELTSDCPSNTYTTQNGLQFNMYCGIDLLAAEVGNTVEASISDCMNQCSWFQPACYGVTYYTQNQTCSFKGDGVNSTMLSTSDSDNVNVSSAIAYANQMVALDETCPYQNNSVIETSEGMPFHIVCDRDMAGWGDYFPWEYDYRPHTETMSECMEICAHAHPLCLGVSWNSDLSAGFGNCYLKNSQNGSLYSETAHTHSGLVNLPSLDACDSVSDPQQIFSNDKTFNVTCFEGRVGSSNFTSVYSANITGCIDECATYNGTESCLAVFYDNSFDDGFENCYLLNGTGTETAPLNSTYAELVSSDNSTSASTSDSSDNSSSSKAWIAGPVIGAVAALTIVALGFLWWRRRRAGRQQDAKFAPIELDQSSPPDKPVRVSELPQNHVTEIDGETVVRHELA